MRLIVFRSRTKLWELILKLSWFQNHGVSKLNWYLVLLQFLVDVVADDVTTYMYGLLMDDAILFIISDQKKSRRSRSDSCRHQIFKSEILAVCAKYCWAAPRDARWWCLGPEVRLPSLYVAPLWLLWGHNCRDVTAEELILILIKIFSLSGTLFSKEEGRVFRKITEIWNSINSVSKQVFLWPKRPPSTNSECQK